MWIDIWAITDAWMHQTKNFKNILMAYNSSKFISFLGWVKHEILIKKEIIIRVTLQIHWVRQHFLMFYMHKLL